MTEQPARYRLRPDEEIEAVQWTGANAEALRAFCGPDFDTIDPEDRAEDPDQDAQLLSDASHWVGLKPMDWVLKHADCFTATSDEAFRAAWEPAVVQPPVDRAARAEALLLHFAAEAHRRKWAYDRGLDDDGVPLKSEAFDALHRLGEEMRTELEKLRRMADEAQHRLAAYQTCPVCKAGYETGTKCSQCAFNARMAAETRPAP